MASRLTPQRMTACDVAIVVGIALCGVLDGIYHGLRDPKEIVVDPRSSLSRSYYNVLHQEFAGNETPEENAESPWGWQTYMFNAGTRLQENYSFNVEAAGREYNFTIVALILRYFYHIWNNFQALTGCSEFQSTFVQLCNRNLFIAFDRINSTLQVNKEFKMPNFRFQRSKHSMNILYGFEPLDGRNGDVIMQIGLFDVNGTKELRIGYVDDIGSPGSMMYVREGEVKMEYWSSDGSYWPVSQR